MWDIASGETTHVLRGHEGSVLCLQYDHEILVSGSSDSTVIVWDLVGDPATGFGRYEDKLKLVGHGMGVLDLCFDDRYIVSCSKVRSSRTLRQSESRHADDRIASSRTRRRTSGSALPASCTAFCRATADRSTPSRSTATAS